MWLWKIINCTLKTFPDILLNILQNLSEHPPASLITFPGIFSNISQNLLKHSPESFRTFPGIFSNIPRNPFEHSPESSRRFPGIFLNIPCNVKIITFSGILMTTWPGFPFFAVLRSFFLGFINILNNAHLMSSYPFTK